MPDAPLHHKGAKSWSESIRSAKGITIGLSVWNNKGHNSLHEGSLKLIRE